MQIEFNTSRITKPNAGQPVSRQDTTPSATDTTSFTAAATLEAQLKDVPAVRTDKVALAQSLISNPDYPSAGVLDKVAGLLSAHIAG